MKPLLNLQSKSQAALEFLTTYAWVFIVISITLGALYTFGVFDFDKYLPQKCTFPSQFECLDFSLKASDFRIKLMNNLGEDITVTSAQVSNDANTPIACTATNPSPDFQWAAATDKVIEFTGCSGGGYIADERVEVKIALHYYADKTPSKPVHVVNGKVNGRVIPD